MYLLYICIAVAALTALGLFDSVLTRRRNYARNQAADKTDPHTGLIGRQESLSAFRFGKQTMDKNGCCCVSVHNAMCLLEPDDAHSLPDTIRSFDTYLGYNVFGLLGGSPWAIPGYFRRRGYRVRYHGFLTGRRRKDVDQVLCDAPVCIVLYKHRGSLAMHYAAVRRDEASGRFISYNTDSRVVSFADQLRRCGRTLIGVWCIDRPEQP